MTRAALSASAERQEPVGGSAAPKQRMEILTPALEPVNTTGISARFLSEKERFRIADLHRVGNSMRFIAAELGHAVSTIG